MDRSSEGVAAAFPRWSAVRDAQYAALLRGDGAGRVLRDRLPELRNLFDGFVAAVRENWAVTVNATKSRVARQVRRRFAGIERPRKDHLEASFLLTTPIQSARLTRVEYVPPYYYVHRLRLRQPADIDAELKRWLAQAYQVGAQRHVTEPDWPKLRQPPSWMHLPREVADAIARGDDPSIVR